jgi:hypothetical protein
MSLTLSLLTKTTLMKLRSENKTSKVQFSKKKKNRGKQNRKKTIFETLFYKLTVTTFQSKSFCYFHNNHNKLFSQHKTLQG